MRLPVRRSALLILWLLVLPSGLLTTGAKGNFGCFLPPRFTHHRGIPQLSDVIVFATAAPDTLQVYSVSQARVTNTLKAVDRLNRMVVSPIDPQGRPNPRAYVVSKAAQVASYDLLTNSVLRHVKLSEDTEATGGAIAVSPDGKYVAVGVGDAQFQVRSIVVLDAADLNRQVARFEIGGDLQDLVANPNPARPELYILNDRASKVRIFDFRTLTLQDAILDLTGSPGDLAISPDGRLAMASINARHKVVFINLETRQLFFEVALPEANPHRIAYCPATPTAYVTDRRVNNSLLYRFDLNPVMQALDSGSTGTLDQAQVVTAKRLPQLLVQAAFVPEHAAVSADGHFLYLTGSNQNHFAVVNLTTLDELIARSPQFSYLLDMASQQLALGESDGLFEVQGVNLAKSPVTFGVLYDSKLAFNFTSQTGKEMPPQVPAP